MRNTLAFMTVFVASTALVAPASADKIKHSIAVFSGLDKITGRIISFEVAANETVQFGTLQITERVCYTRPPTEAPQTDTFVEVDEIDPQSKPKRIFTGWMFAASPGLHALDQPVYDIWLTDCKGNSQLIPSPPQAAEVETPLPADIAKPQPPVKPQGKARRSGGQAAQTHPSGGGPIQVGPPPGFIPPSQRQQEPPPQEVPPVDPDAQPGAQPDNGSGF